MRKTFALCSLLLCGCTTAGDPALITTYGTAVIRVAPETFALNLDLSSLDADPAVALTQNERKLEQVKPEDFVIDNSSVAREILEGEGYRKGKRFEATRRLSITLPELQRRDQLIMRLMQQQLGEVFDVANGVKDPISTDCFRLSSDDRCLCTDRGRFQAL